MSICLPGNGWGDPSASSTNGGGSGANGWQAGPPGAGTQVPTASDSWSEPTGPSSAAVNSNNWNSSNASQWAGTSPGNASSWSDVARKNVPQSMAPPPQPPAVRPKGASYDNGWGAPVDQGTPWGGPGAAAAAAAAVKSNEWNNGGTANWTGGNGGSANWNGGNGGGNKHKQDAYGNNDRGNSSSHWNAGQQNSGRSNSNSFNSNEHQQPSNVWTGPPSAQDGLDNSMVWNNPYPKKTFQPDKGTNAWGDPSGQTAVEIKRWKASSDDNAPAETSPVVTSTSQTASVWSDSPMAPQPKSSWNNGGSPTNVPVPNQTSSVTSPSWDSQNVNPLKTAAQSSIGGWGAADNGWNGPSKPIENNRQSSGSGGELESDISADDVFSNPNTPLTPFGPPIQNGTSSILQAKYPVVAQSSQQSTGNSMQNNAQLQQMLTKQISMQLKQCVQAGLIDIQLLNQQLSEESLHRLNQLLSLVPTFEKAQQEMQRLQMLQRQGQTLNPTQNQELKRLTEDVQRYTLKIQQIKQQIYNKQRQMSNEALSPINGATDVFGQQSKLFSQWKNGSSSEIHEKKMSVSSSAPNLENLEQGIAMLNCHVQNDTWSNKRHSGADWPTSEMNKSEKGSHGNTSCDSNSFDIGDSLSNNLDSEGRNQFSGMSPSSGLDDNRQDFPQEFKPGHPWQWRDPNKVAEDPNATPGSIKTNALNKLSLDSAFQNSPYFGFSGGQSAFGSVTPTKMNFDMKPSTVSPSLSADSYITQRHSRPPSTLGQPFNTAANHRPPMMNKPFNAPFVPYNANMAQWIVLTNVNQIDEHSLQILMNRFGTTTTFVYPPNSNLALLKFRDAPYERLLPRMQHELATYGVSVQIMKENEVERLLQALSNRLQPSAVFNTNAHAPPPLWDAPPPPLGAWAPPGGPHPFAPGGMPNATGHFSNM